MPRRQKSGGGGCLRRNIEWQKKGVGRVGQLGSTNECSCWSVEGGGGVGGRGRKRTRRRWRLRRRRSNHEREEEEVEEAEVEEEADNSSSPLAGCSRVDRVGCLEYSGSQLKCPSDS